LQHKKDFRSIISSLTAADMNSVFIAIEIANVAKVIGGIELRLN